MTDEAIELVPGIRHHLAHRERNEGFPNDHGYQFHHGVSPEGRQDGRLNHLVHQVQHFPIVFGSAEAGRFSSDPYLR